MNEEIKKDRSPNYPKLPLEQSIELVKKLFDRIGKAKVKPEVAIGPLGYTGLNGSSLTTLGALTAYGLLDRTRGEGPPVLGVSALAIKLIHPINEAQLVESRREAALNPKVFGELFSSGFNHVSEDVLCKHLIQNGFTEDGANKAASVFVANVLFSKLDSESSIFGVQDTKPGVEAMPRPELKTPSIAAFGRSSTLNEFTFPLPSGLASIKLPSPMTEEDFSTLVDMLQVFKKGLVKPQLALIDCNDPEWQAKARALAQGGYEFNLIHFSYAHHIGFYNSLSVEFDLDSSFNPNTGQAFFKPTKQQKAG